MLHSSCRWCLFVAALGLALTSLVSVEAAPVPQPQAMTTSDGPSLSWAVLTPGQRAVLLPLQADWDALEPERQGKWLEIARRWPALSAQDQQRLQRRMARWARMTAEERSLARLRFQQTRRVEAEQRRTAWEAYQALPPEERLRWAAQGNPPPGPRLAAGAGVLAGALRPVGPALVQAAPGVSTVSVNRMPWTPHQQRRTAQPGKPSIPAHVDGNTLLPRHDHPSGDVSLFPTSR